jgi:Xaa-Pro aminopeptidase
MSSPACGMLTLAEPHLLLAHVTIMSFYKQRISRAQEALRSAGLGGAIFAPTDQMRYLTGWAEYGHERLIALFLPADGEPAFVVPSMNASQAEENPAAIPTVFGWDDKTGWHPAAARILEGWNLAGRGLAIDDELYSVHLLGIQDLAPGVRCTPAADLMARLREIKTADELALMRRSAEVTDSVYESSLPHIREGMTELQLQDIVTQEYARFGTKPAFALICFGPNTAIPHHHVGEARLRRGSLVVMDIGCLLQDYASDITRTFSFCSPEQEAHEVYNIVHQAHCAAFEVGRPGVTCEAIDAAARKVIEEAGYGEYFIHRTGHGIGLSTHEPPYIVEGNRQPLQVGMCFSDEPGIYLPGRFGVRIENIVTVEADGLRHLNAVPPEKLLVLDA